MSTALRTMEIAGSTGARVVSPVTIGRPSTENVIA